METGRWWLAVTMDDHNDDQWTMDDAKNEMGDDGQQQGHTNAAPLPLIHPCVVVASHSIFSKLDTCFPYVRSSKTGPQPVETETGWDQSFNWWKPMKTALNQLMSVQSSFSRFFNLWGPVLSNFDKRPDWTRLPSTAINYVGVQGLVLRTLNGQRTWIAWSAYMHTQPGCAPIPVEVAHLEQISEHPVAFWDSKSSVLLGQCTMGSSFLEILSRPIPLQLLELFKDERYLLWFDHHCEKTNAHGSGEACNMWTELMHEPYLNNSHTHFKNLNTLSPTILVWCFEFGVLKVLENTQMFCLVELTLLTVSQIFVYKNRKW